MKMRHFWRWPVLCSMLFGLASAGSAAGLQGPLAAGGGESVARNGTPRLAHDARLHARVEAIRVAMGEARASRSRPAALRALADRVERAAGRMVDDSLVTPAAEVAVQALLADLYLGADGLRSASKPVRMAGMARIDGALHEYALRFDPPAAPSGDAAAPRA
jgi:hypothetical protein